MKYNQPKNFEPILRKPNLIFGKKLSFQQLEGARATHRRSNTQMGFYEKIIETPKKDATFLGSFTNGTQSMMMIP